MKREDPAAAHPDETTAPAPGVDPAHDQAVAEDPGMTKASPPESPPTGEEPTATYFDFMMHERVQKLHSGGIFTDLGRRWGGLQIRIRALHVRSVVVRREAAEQAARLALALDDSDPIPPSEGIEINKATVTMALTGARGRVNASPAQIAMANANGWPVETIPATDKTPELHLVTFTGEERDQQEEVRDFFAPVLEVSMPFMTTLIRASRQLQKVRDEEIDKLGKDFVFGQHVKLDWAD